jgi:hypothetical protein
MNDNQIIDPAQQGFKWWRTWAWLGLTIGNLYILGIAGKEIPIFAAILIGVNSILCIYILKMNKYAFLWATILSVNPLIWIVNGIYLKNRWTNPLVNK